MISFLVRIRGGNLSVDYFRVNGADDKQKLLFVPFHWPSTCEQKPMMSTATDGHVAVD